MKVTLDTALTSCGFNILIWFYGFYLKRFSLNSAKYYILIRGPKLWNNVINKEEKDIQSCSLFQKKIKSKLIETENETDYF